MLRHRVLTELQRNYEKLTAPEIMQSVDINANDLLTVVNELAAEDLIHMAQDPSTNDLCFTAFDEKCL